MEDNNSNRETGYEKSIGTTSLLANISSPELSEGYGRLFLRYSQMGELLLDIIGHKIKNVPKNIKESLLKNAASDLLSACNDWVIAGDLAHSLEGYHPSEFYKIRPALQGGGGNQSPSFRKIIDTSREILDEYLLHLRSNSLELKQVHELKNFDNKLHMLTQAMLNFDSAYQLFEKRHLLLIRRIIGQRGLTPLGNDVADLERRLSTPLFPKLWESI